MAAAAVMPASIPAQAKPAWKPIIMEPQASKADDVEFDPDLHLSFKEAPKVHTMTDLGLPEDTGISPIAVSEPFPLFTFDAVMRMRQEILSPEVLGNCQYSSNLAQCQLRGFVNKYAPFVYDVWKNPKTLAIVSKIAGIDLVPEMDFELAHVNISVKSEEEREEELAAFAERAEFEADEGIAGCPWEDDKPIVDWHTDSYPFVCVTMLSDCRTMIGGETALRTGTGDIMKVRGPQMGCAVILQGRYIEHQALRALGAAERISMVTSFRPRCPSVRDDTVLTTVRPISIVSELYNQFAEYRLEILEERVRQQLRELRDAHAAGRRVATKKLKAFLDEQERFLAHMNREMVDDERVVRGSIDDSHLLNPKTESKVEPTSKKRMRRM
ncbi:Uu.00g041160.m01.CDS01 [Anthostomella pinea]|uniref:Uu.00g041160.m01.CDS01 n=1 Tax=Anthostomella pinea TaxID=933095 RepID=A0AAI8V5D3_9PEZI|nr:Uu.00g041160.m01.CDS01 [Anthostomella pinea]